MSKLSNARRRLTKKQRKKVKREQEAAHKRFMRRGYIGAAGSGDRPVRASGAPAESPRERHQRERAERDEARKAERRAEHEVVAGKRWVVAAACIGQEARLVQKLREARIPYFRARDEVVRVRSGRAQNIQVPVVARTVFVGVENRKHLEALAQEHPWLMERLPGQRHGRCEQADRYGHERFDKVRVGEWLSAVPGATFPWLIDHVERVSGVDEHGDGMVVTALVPERQMQAFADCLVDAEPLVAGRCPFELGETVRVAEGPFASFDGVIEEIDPARQRLNVAVSIFGRATPVELEFRQVDRA